MKPDATSVVSPRQTRLIRQSLESLEDYSNSLTKLFYGRLFELAPSTRHLFKVSLEEQSRKLLEMLVTAAEALDDFESLRPRLTELGRKHVTYGAKPEHYDVLRTALLWALAQALEQEFDPDTKAAWEQMLRVISETMLEGAAQGTQPRR
jgi:hemoglobin-like flavoprotein